MNHSRAAVVESLESRTLMSCSVPQGDGPQSTEPPLVATLAKPTELKGSSTAGTGVTLTWRDNSSDETGFAIFRYCKGKITQLGTVDADVTTFTDTTAPVGTDLYVVRAFNDAGRSEGSNAAVVKVDPVVQVRAPRKLRSAAKSTTSIKLCWEGDSGATGGYVIERSSDETSGWTQVGTSTERKFTDTGLTAKTKYYYRITVLGPDGQTATSAVLIGVTKWRDGGEPKK